MTITEQQIISISNMIDGIDISISRIQELKERFIFNHDPFDSSEEMTFALDVIRDILVKDSRELKVEMRKLQKKL